MPTLQATDIADLVNSMQEDWKKNAWVDISVDLQDYPTVALLEKGKKTHDGGLGPGWKVKVASAGSARYVGIGEQDVVDIPDLTEDALMRWRWLNANAAWYVQELAIATGPNKIFDIIKMRTIGMREDIIKLMETSFWGLTAASDTKTPFGIDNHIVWNATDGFTGGHAAGYTDWATLSRTTYPNLKNYSFTAAQITRDDFVAGLKKAAYKTNFRAPVPHPEVSPGADDWTYHTVYDAVATMEQILEDSNDNLGKDLAFYDGRVLFRGRPISAVPALEGKGWCPVYGINWKDVEWAVLSGMDMVVGPATPLTAGLQHSAVVQNTDSSCQLVLHDPRKHFVGKITSIANS